MGIYDERSRPALQAARKAAGLGGKSFAGTVRAACRGTPRALGWPVVTGAGSGIGAAVARRFGERGVVVALVGRTPEKLEAIARDPRDRRHRSPRPSGPRRGGCSSSGDRRDGRCAGANRRDRQQRRHGEPDRARGSDGRAVRSGVRSQRSCRAVARSGCLPVTAPESAAVVNVSSAAAWLYRPQPGGTAEQGRARVPRAHSPQSLRPTGSGEASSLARSIRRSSDRSPTTSTLRRTTSCA